MALSAIIATQIPPNHCRDDSDRAGHGGHRGTVVCVSVKMEGGGAEGCHRPHGFRALRVADHEPYGEQVAQDDQRATEAVVRLTLLPAPIVDGDLGNLRGGDTEDGRHETIHTT